VCNETAVLTAEESAKPHWCRSAAYDFRPISGEIELLGKSLRATMATMASQLVGNQCRPDLLDAPITIIFIFMDSAGAATQNDVSEISIVL